MKRKLLAMLGTLSVLATGFVLSTPALALSTYKCGKVEAGIKACIDYEYFPERNGYAFYGFITSTKNLDEVKINLTDGYGRWSSPAIGPSGPDHKILHAFHNSAKNGNARLAVFYPSVSPYAVSGVVLNG